MNEINENIFGQKYLSRTLLVFTRIITQNATHNVTENINQASGLFIFPFFVTTPRANVSKLCTFVLRIFFPFFIFFSLLQNSAWRKYKYFRCIFVFFLRFLFYEHLMFRFTEIRSYIKLKPILYFYPCSNCVSQGNWG